MKRLYHMIALLALINLFAVGGLVGFLFASGKLNAERVHQIAMVLRGASPQPSAPTTQPVQPEPPPQGSREEIARLQAQKEYYALIASRYQRELEDRRALNQAIQHDVLLKLEQIEAKEKAFKEDRRKTLDQTQQDGFAQALEIYSSMNAKLARDLMRTTMKEPDAIQLLMAMDENRRKNIVNACKTDEERLWIGRILNQIQKLTNEATNGVDGPVVSK